MVINIFYSASKRLSSSYKLGNKVIMESWEQSFKVIIQNASYRKKYLYTIYWRTKEHALNMASVIKLLRP